MQDPKIYTISITKEELDLIGATLAEMPYRMVAGLLVKLQAQMVVQQKSPGQDQLPAGGAQDGSSKQDQSPADGA